MPTDLHISSPSNPRIKAVVKLRQRSHRDTENLMIIEGYRELLCAAKSRHTPSALFVCPELFQGENEPALIELCRSQGATIFTCDPTAFRKMAYRDRPEGLLALAPPVTRPLEQLELGSPPLLVVAEAIEKPGNLGTILRSADASSVDAVIVCDRCTDLTNPNVVRASIGTLFSVPVADASSPDALAWLREHNVQLLAATPHAQALHTEVDLTGPVAIAVGSEQVGLSPRWMDAADIQVRIPMLGHCDSLNVATATTILLYEAVRQRMNKGIITPPPSIHDDGNRRHNTA